MEKHEEWKKKKKWGMEKRNHKELRGIRGEKTGMGGKIGHKE